MCSLTYEFCEFVPCITNHDKLADLKQHSLSHISLDQNSGWAPVGYLLEIPQDQHEGVHQPGLSIIWSLWGEICFKAYLLFIRILAEFSSYYLWIDQGSLSATGDHSPVFACGHLNLQSQQQFVKSGELSPPHG